MPPEEEETEYWKHDTRWPPPRADDTVWCTCGRSFTTRQARRNHWAYHPADSRHCIPDSEYGDSRAPDPAGERMQVQQQQQASAYHRRLMQREQALATAELIRLDEQYPVWALGCDTLDWGRQRCAYITGDDDALNRMTGYVSADSPALWEATPRYRPPMLITRAGRAVLGELDHIAHHPTPLAGWLALVLTLVLAALISVLT